MILSCDTYSTASADGDSSPESYSRTDTTSDNTTINLQGVNDDATDDSSNNEKDVVTITHTLAPAQGDFKPRYEGPRPLASPRPLAKKREKGRETGPRRRPARDLYQGVVDNRHARPLNRTTGHGGSSHHRCR